MSTGTAVALTPVERYVAQVLPEDVKAPIYQGLPDHVNPQRFRRNLANALMANPKFLELDPRLVMREVSKAAALGLYIDPALGEAYLIPGWNGKARREEPQLRIGYRGLIKLGRQAGDLVSIYAHPVREHDEFEETLGDQKRLHHKPRSFGDCGEVLGYYAVAKLKDGSTDFEVMSNADIHAIRDRSDGWKAFIAKRIQSTPWSTDEGEMARKTVIRRLMKRLPQSPEMADALRTEDEHEHSEFGPRSRFAQVAPFQVVASPLVDAIEQQPAGENAGAAEDPDAEVGSGTSPLPASGDGAGAPIAEPPAPDQDDDGFPGADAIEENARQGRGGRER